MRTYVAAVETQSTRHIKPLHWYIANRLVIEGGFMPDEIVPRPPFRVESSGTGRSLRHRLVYDQTRGGSGEHTILGGVKTKQVDVTVSKAGIGPCIAISVKGTVGAFRNLTNRMEEAIGDCTNLHISYPNLVYGFLHVLKATSEAPAVPRNDVAILSSGKIVDSIQRYHDAMAELTGRRGVRNDFTRYEAVAIALVSPSGDAVGEVIPSFPASTSRLLFAQFFDAIYKVYEHRFVYAAPDLRRLTRRLEPVFTMPPDAEPDGILAKANRFGTGMTASSACVHAGKSNLTLPLRTAITLEIASRRPITSSTLHFEVDRYHAGKIGLTPNRSDVIADPAFTVTVKDKVCGAV